jgi:3-oxoacyl-[acyl-carrier protein] reductase
VILITGSATGLGAAVAVGAAKRGAKAMLLNCTKSVREAELTADAVRAAGSQTLIAQGDVAEDADCRRIATTSPSPRRCGWPVGRRTLPSPCCF